LPKTEPNIVGYRARKLFNDFVGYRLITYLEHGRRVYIIDLDLMVYTAISRLLSFDLLRFSYLFDLMRFYTGSPVTSLRIMTRYWHTQNQRLLAEH